MTQRLQQHLTVAKYVIVLCDDTRDLSKQRLTGSSNKYYIMRGWRDVEDHEHMLDANATQCPSKCCTQFVR